MNEKETRKKLHELKTIVETTNEEEFLKYLIRCCENTLENENIMNLQKVFEPTTMQLIKLRAEVTQRLQTVYDVNYGHFSTGTHLIKRLVR